MPPPSPDAIRKWTAHEAELELARRGREAAQAHHAARTRLYRVKAMGKPAREIGARRGAEWIENQARYARLQAAHEKMRAYF